MEMSRQRIRSSVLESSTEKCPHCGGTGHVRSVSSVTLHLLRMIEEMLLKGATHNLIVRTAFGSRALCAQPQARASARPRKPLPDHHHGQCRRECRRRAAVPDREGRAGAQRRRRQGDPGATTGRAAAVEEDEDVFEETEDEAEDETRASLGARRSPVRMMAKPKPTRPSKSRPRDRKAARRKARTDSGADAAVAADAGADAKVPRVAAGRAKAAWSSRRPRTRYRMQRRTMATKAPPRPAKPRTKVRRQPRANRTDKQFPANPALMPSGGAAAVDAVADGATGADARAKPGRAPNGHDGEARDGQHGVEPEVADAIADLGGPSREDAPIAPEQHSPQPFEPVARDLAVETARARASAGASASASTRVSA